MAAFKGKDLSLPFKAALSFFIIFPFIFHHAYIFVVKNQDREAYFTNAAEIRKKLAGVSGEGKVEITMEEAVKGLKNWQIVNPIQLHGYLYQHLGEDLYRKVLPFRKQFPTYQFIYGIK